MIRALIMDFDGTILDTETPEYDAWSEVYARHGARLELEAWGRGVGTWDAFDPHAHLEALTGKTFEQGCFEAEVRERVLHVIHGLRAMPGVVEALDAARERGLRLAVASSSSETWVMDGLERLRLRHHFEALATRFEVERVKPDPALYLLAAEKLGLEPAACLAVEDSPNGAKAAIGAGMRTAVVPNAVTRGLAFPEGVVRLEQFNPSTLGALLDGA